MFKKKFDSDLNKILSEREERRQIIFNNHFEREKHKAEEKRKKEALRNENNIEKKHAKELYKKEKDEVVNRRAHFRWYNFFTKWFLLGVILVCVSVCISLISDAFVPRNNELVRNLLSIAVGIFSSVGVALFLGCVFDFSRNSEAFMSFISKILTDIIVSKTFLTQLAAGNKKEALKLILQPSNKQIEQYSNINEYFKKKLDDYMKMFDTNFKTNVILNIEAKKDSKGMVYCDSILSYTIYKVRDEFEPINLYLDKDTAASNDVKIIYEEGERSIKPEDIREGSINTGGIIQKTFIFDIPQELQKYDHLTIRRKMYEPGHDHWISYNWESLTPYESITCHIKCFDDLTVKEYMIFDNKAYYHTELSGDKTSLNITSSQWLEADTGFYVIISDTNYTK